MLLRELESVYGKDKKVVFRTTEDKPAYCPSFYTGYLTSDIERKIFKSLNHRRMIITGDHTLDKYKHIVISVKQCS